MDFCIDKTNEDQILTWIYRLKPQSFLCLSRTKICNSIFSPEGVEQKSKKRVTLFAFQSIKKMINHQKNKNTVATAKPKYLNPIIKYNKLHTQN